MDRPIHRDVERVMQEREKLCVSAGDGEPPHITAEESEGYTAVAAVPVIAAGDPIGAVLLLSRDEGAAMGQAEMKVLETAAHFLGKQMES